MIRLAIIDLLPERVRKLVEERFTHLTPPQEKAIPLILNGRNVLIVAPTGTGKTEAAILPILAKIERGGGIKVLYVTPLRALNRDILDRLAWWFSKVDLRIAVRHGDTSKSERRAQAISPPDVMITTPETFQLLLIGRRLRLGLRTVKWVVVDEVHELADDRRGVQLSILLERLRRFAKKTPQFIGLSATLGNPEEVASLVAGELPVSVVYTPVSKRFEVRIEWPDVTPEDRELAAKLFVAPEVVAKLRRIRELVEEHRATLVFTNTRPASEMIGSRLRLWDEKIPVYVHHGSLSLGERVRVEEMLKKGEIKGVICTSSLELGIDIGHVDLVIQYGSPREVRRLIQRVGRSGHKIGEISRGVILVSSSDDALEASVLWKFLREEKVEPARIPYKPYDVLVHELVGMALTGGYTVEEAFNIVKSTPSFSGMDKGEYESVVAFAQQASLLRVGVDGALRPGQRSFKYFYGVLSMIPETKQYIVVEEGTSEAVGILDDFFVAEYCEPGARFIMAGRPWTVVYVGEEEVVVRRAEDYRGAVPSWVGEEIPVPFEVALEVGRIRREASERLLKGEPIDVIVSAISEELAVDEKVVAKSLNPAFKMTLKGLPVPSDKVIVVEEFEDMIVVHAHFGTKVNRTLARYVAYEVTRTYGLPVYTSEKPYRIVLRAPGVPGEYVAEILRRISPDKLREAVTKAAEDSRGFKWRLQQIARRMGVIEPDVKLERGAVDKLVATLKGTPVYAEALKETLYRDMDLETASKVAKWVEEGRVEVKYVEGPTPLAEEHFRYYAEYLEPVAPEKRDVLRYMLFKAKLYSSFITIACLDCLEYIEEVALHTVERRPRCPLCGSSRLAVSRLSKEEVERRLLRKSKLRHLLASSALVRNWGRVAAVVIAAGLNPYEARRILEEVGHDEERALRRAWIKIKEKTAKYTKRQRELSTRTPS